MLLNSSHLQAFIQNIITKSRICTTVWILITSETSSHCVAQAVFELAVVPLSAQCRDCRWVPPDPDFQVDTEKEEKQSHQFLAQPSSCSSQYVTSCTVPRACVPGSHCEVGGNPGALLAELLSGLVNISPQPLVGLFPVDRCGHVTLCSHKALLSPFLLRLLHIRKQYLHVRLPSCTAGLCETQTVLLP